MKLFHRTRCGPTLNHGRKMCLNSLRRLLARDGRTTMVSSSPAGLSSQLESGTNFGSHPFERSEKTRKPKKHPRTEAKTGAPEFNHEALRVDGWATPAWAMARPITRDRSQSRVTYNVRVQSMDTAQGTGSRHIHSARTTSEAIGLSKTNTRRSIAPDSSYAFIKMLQQCSKENDYSAAKQVHDSIIQAQMDKNLYVASTLLNAYIKCGQLRDARRVFDGLEKKDVIVWNAMISGYAKSDHAESAMGLFESMCQEGVQPNAVTFLAVLKACTSPSALAWGREVHACARNAGFESDVRVATALLQMYAKCGRLMEARHVFDRMAKRDVFSWNLMIGGLAREGLGHEAYGLFLQMRREGFQPNVYTYASIFNASSSAGALEWVRDVHGHARAAGLQWDLRMGNALVHMYAESGSIDDARLVFDSMEKRDVVTWTTMIDGLALHGCGQEALALFRRMNADLVTPNRTTFVAILSACSHGGLVDDGRRLFSAMRQEYGIEPDIVHYTCMVDLLGRAGNLEEAKLFIDDMPIQPNGVTWTALLGACRTYGDVEMGEFAARELLRLEPRDPSGYVLLSNLYAAAGEWENVSMVRSWMQREGLRKEPGRTWIEVGKKVHEFAVGDTSHPEAEAIYAELTSLTENLKAEGYIPDPRLVLNDTNEDSQELALCSHSEKLAVVYGLMHTPGKEPIRVRKNLRVCPDCHTATKLISKVTGRQIIARDANRFHHFEDGVCSCGDYW